MFIHIFRIDFGMRKSLFFCAMLWFGIGFSQSEFVEFLSIETIDSADHQIVSAIALLDAEPEKIWQAITDFENYAEFMPQVMLCNRDRIDEKSSKVFIDLDVPWPVSNIYYEMKISERSDHLFFRWDHIGGDLIENKGFWSLEVIAPNQTKLTYHVCVKTKSVLPNFIIRLAQKIKTKDIFYAVEKRANQYFLNSQ